MLIKRKKSHGSTSYLTKHKQLRAIAGSATSWFTEFRPVRFPAIENFHHLLFQFYLHGLGFFLTWASVYFTAGILNSCRAASVFMALLDHPVIHLIFQRGPTIIQNFHIESFSFGLVQFVPADDIHIYHVSNDDFCMLMLFLSIHISSCCDYRSNVDFVHFIWQLLERISMK